MQESCDAILVQLGNLMRKSKNLIAEIEGKQTIGSGISLAASSRILREHQNGASSKKLFSSAALREAITRAVRPNETQTLNRI